MALQRYNDQDSKFIIARKILDNQALILEAINQSAGDTVITEIPVTAADIIVGVAGIAKQGVAQATPRGVAVAGRQGNTGIVYIGDSTITNASGSKQGYPLSPTGLAIHWNISNMSQLFVNADTGGDGVSVTIL